MSILNGINDHRDLAALNEKERQALCEEIRRFLISNLSETGGHLASNLGVVELTVAIETVFDTHKDRLVFDVGHQSYVHKLLTGRRADFVHLRQFGGIAGFPKPCESPADAFVAGHASSSVSIALGMARARTFRKEDYHVLALIGDGAATGGMAYEGMNDAAVSKEPMIVILNDNEMSIARNVGGMAKHLAKLRTKEQYLGMKERYRSALEGIPGGAVIYRLTRAVKDWVKRVLVPTTFFENMGLTYLGPVDGHDVENLIQLLRHARDLKRPVLLHVLTQKGRGYQPAEAEPSKFHGVGKFDLVSGELMKKGGETFSHAFGRKLTELAEKEERICAITAAMPAGTGLTGFQNTFPNRLLDVGIAEEHAVSMAGGLAKQGMIPVVALYSTFLQRSFDQILQDIAMLRLHVVLGVDRAGLVGEDGETHHGVFDVGFLRQVPGMRLLCPASCRELEDMLEWAVHVCDGPVAIRYPRGGNRGYHESAWGNAVCCHRTGKDIAVITYGTMLENVIQAADILSGKGVESTVLRLLSLSPLPLDEICDALSGCKQVLIVEESAAGSGILEELAYGLSSRLPEIRVRGLNLGKSYVTHGSIPTLYQKLGLDGVSIADAVLEEMSNEG